MQILPKRIFSDAPFLMFEAPESRVHLQEMCEGKVIARLCWELNEDVPVGASAFGLEFETGERLVIMALPVTEGPWMARLVWRWLPAQAIWTKAMRRHHGQDRVSAGETPPDFLQRQIEGQVIVGILKPTHLGLGERLDAELRDGSRMVIEALPTGFSIGLGGHCDLEVRREHRHQVISHA